MMNSLLAKFAQPSSWAGLGAVLGLCGINVSSGTLALIVQVGAGICGLIAIVINEQAAKKSVWLAPFVIGTLALGMLSACAPALQKSADQLQQVLDQLANTLTSDLQAADAAALAAMPPDTDFDACAKATLQVQAAVQKVTAAGGTKNAGAVTLAEIASLYVPGSDQYNWAQSTLVSGCAAKVQKVTGNIAGAGAVIGAIPMLLKLAPVIAAGA